MGQCFICLTFLQMLDISLATFVYCVSSAANDEAFYSCIVIIIIRTVG